VAKDHCARGGGFGNVVLPHLPLPLADRAPARTRTSLRSNMRALLARSPARLRHRQRRVSSFAAGHPWPAFSHI